MVFFVIIFSLLFILLAYKSLEGAVQLLIFALPSYLIRFQIGPLPSTLLEVMIWLVFLVWFVKYSGLTQYLKGEDKVKRFLIDRKKKTAYPFGLEIMALLVISFVAVGVSGFTNSALGAWKAYFFEPILLYIVVLNVFSHNVILEPKAEESLKGGSPEYKGFLTGARNDRNYFSKLLWPLLFSALGVSLLAVYQKITGNLIDNPYWAAAATRRAVSFFGYPNAVGLYLGPLSVLFVGWLFYVIARSKATKQSQVTSDKPEIATLLSVARNDKIKKITIVIAIVLSFIAIIFAASAGAILGVSAGLVVFFLLISRRSRIAVVAVIALAVIGCAAVPLARHQAYDKLTLRDFSGTVRRIGWNDTWKMLSDGRLIFGAGLANFQATVKPYHQQGFYVSDGTPDFWERLKTDATLRARTWQPLEIYLYPHNIFLNFWSELGLAGMLLFVWIIGKYFFIGLKLLSVIPAKAGIQKDTLDSGKILDPRLRGDDNKKFLVLGLISAMVVVVVHGLVDVPYFKNDLAVMFWLMVAMTSMINNYQTQNTL